MNGYMRNKKFEAITQMYKDAAHKGNVQLDVVYTDTLTYGIENNELSVDGIVLHSLNFVLFLDKDIRLGKVLTQMGIRLFNTPEVIGCCDDKSATFVALAGQGIEMPQTLIAPLVYTGTYKGQDDVYINKVEAKFGYPLVIKESFGSFGDQVYKVDSREELIKKRQELAEIPHIYQVFVSSSYGRDVRINVVGQEVVACMLRTSEHDFRANITNGGQMHQFECPDTFKNMALKVCQILGADFAGVDILFGEDEEPVLCEVNSNAHIKNIYECTGINVAEKIIELIIKKCRID